MHMHQECHDQGPPDQGKSITAPVSALAATSQQTRHMRPQRGWLHEWCTACHIRTLVTPVEHVTQHDLVADQSMTLQYNKPHRARCYLHGTCQGEDVAPPTILLLASASECNFQQHAMVTCIPVPKQLHSPPAQLPVVCSPACRPATFVQQHRSCSGTNRALQTAIGRTWPGELAAARPVWPAMPFPIP